MGKGFALKPHELFRSLVSQHGYSAGPRVASQLFLYFGLWQFATAALSLHPDLVQEILVAIAAKDELSAGRCRVGLNGMGVDHGQLRTSSDDRERTQSRNGSYAVLAGG